MRVFLTGNRGRVGSYIEPHLREAGHEIVGFDLYDGFDVRNRKQIDERIGGCDAVVHLVALNAGSPLESQLDAVLHGTSNVLAAAADARIKRFVNMSSPNAMGIFLNQSLPNYLPIDDDHPERPSSVYGIAKLLADEACRAFTEHHGITTICLRPLSVKGDIECRRLELSATKQPPTRRFFEYGGFLHERDLGAAVNQALVCDFEGHTRLLLCAPDIHARDFTSRQVAQQLFPDVEWRGGEEYAREPYRALIDTTAARELLGWTPVHSWQAYLASERPVLPPIPLRRRLRGFAGQLKRSLLPSR